MSLPADHSFRIVTKTPVFETKKITSENILLLKKTFTSSLKKLKQSSIYALLVHRPADLFCENGELILEVLTEFKRNKLVDKIGVSVYNSHEIEKVFAMGFDIDLIQLPLNVLDQRLLTSGTLKDLKKKKIEIHARSIFLQGLLLKSPEELDPFFNPVRPILKKYHQYIESIQLTPLQSAISFVQHVAEVDHLIIGIENLAQFNQLLTAETVRFQGMDAFKHFSVDDERYLNPSKWTLKGGNDS